MKNMKLWDWVVHNQRLQWTIIEYFVSLKKILFFFCMYKLIQISKEEYKKWEVIIVDKGRYFWVYRKRFRSSIRWEIKDTVP